MKNAKSVEKIKIGILSQNYAAQRLFINRLPNGEYKDVRALNWCMWKKAHLWFLRTIHKLKLSPEETAAKLFYDYRAIIDTGCDILHFFNCINHDRKPHWVVSVESGVPWSMSVTRAVESTNADLSVIKEDPYVLARIKDLASDNCLALLPLSACSYEIQMDIIKQYPEYAEKIKAKTFILHPPQESVINSIEEKGISWDENEDFIFFYVGRNFYRKGGRETVQVLVELRKKYKNFKLLLVSSMDKDEDRYMRSENDEKDARELISSNSDWIEFYDSLPNEQVIRKLISSHVCLLPTWMDTYAYSVLESQACGTPLITTAQRALNEINNEKVGWLINVPVNRLNNPLHNTKEEQEVFYKIILDGLYEKCEYVLTHRQEVKQKSEACIDRIRSDHNPKEYSQKLELIYGGHVGDLIRSIE